jgi:hypothetical protein
VLAQLFVVAELLLVIDRGGPADLAQPLRDLAERLPATGPLPLTA